MRKFGCMLLLLILCCCKTSAQTYVFAKLDGAPVNTTGWNMQGAARVGNTSAGAGNNAEIVLCPATTFTSGAIFVNEPINLSTCSKWKAEFDFRMFDGTAADGIAFCFLDVPPTGFVNGEGLGIPATANGLKICFDTWRNCGSAVPKIQIRWGSGYGGECSTMPTLDNTNGNLSFLRSTTYNHARIEYNNGNISVYVNNILYLTGFQQFNFAGYLGFTASTGGNTDVHSIKNVIIYTEMPPSEAGADREICPGQTASLGTSFNADYVYTWTPAQGLSGTNISNPDVSLNGTARVQKFYVRTAYASNPGCSSVDSVNVTVKPTPVMNWKPAPFCKRSPSPIWDSSYTLDGTDHLLSYHWNFGDGITAAVKSPTHTYNNPGSYDVTLVLEAANGCKSSGKEVVIVSDYPVADFKILSDSVCSDMGVIIEDRSSVSFGNITKTKIDWDYPNSLSTADSSYTSNELFTHQYNSFTSPLYQQKVIRYTAVTGTTCETSKLGTVTLKAIPHLQFDSIAPVCQGSGSVTISQALNTTSATGTGTYLGNIISSEGVVNTNAASAAAHNISYQYRLTNGCADTISRFFNIYPKPVVDAGGDRAVLEKGSLVLETEVSGGNRFAYQWTPGRWLSSDTVASPIVSPQSDITYQISVINDFGCSTTDAVNIKILKLPVIPNAFSPNKDGTNDEWKILYLDSYSNCTVEVYNRFGQRVFSSFGYNIPWNGTMNNKELPVGVYYYVINTKVEGRVLTGWVMLLR